MIENQMNENILLSKTSKHSYSWKKHIGYTQKIKVKEFDLDEIEYPRDSLIDTANLNLQAHLIIKLNSTNSIRESGILQAEKVDLSHSYIKTGKALYIKAKEIDITDAKIDVPKLYIAPNTNIINNSQNSIFDYNIIKIADSEKQMNDFIKEASIIQDQSSYIFYPFRCDYSFMKTNNISDDGFLPAEILSKFINFKPYNRFICTSPINEINFNSQEHDEIKLPSIFNIEETAIIKAKKVDLSNCNIKTGKALYIHANEINITDAKIDVPIFYVAPNTKFTNNSQNFNFDFKILKTASSEEQMNDFIKEASIIQNKTKPKFDFYKDFSLMHPEDKTESSTLKKDQEAAFNKMMKHHNEIKMHLQKEQLANQVRSNAGYCTEVEKIEDEPRSFASLIRIDPNEIDEATKKLDKMGMQELQNNHDTQVRSEVVKTTKIVEDLNCIRDEEKYTKPEENRIKVNFIETSDEIVAYKLDFNADAEANFLIDITANKIDNLFEVKDEQKEKTIKSTQLNDEKLIEPEGQMHLPNSFTDKIKSSAKLSYNQLTKAAIELASFFYITKTIDSDKDITTPENQLIGDSSLIQENEEIL